MLYPCWLRAHCLTKWQLLGARRNEFPPGTNAQVHITQSAQLAQGRRKARTVQNARIKLAIGVTRERIDVGSKSRRYLGTSN